MACSYTRVAGALPSGGKLSDKNRILIRALLPAKTGRPHRGGRCHRQDITDNRLAEPRVPGGGREPARRPFHRPGEFTTPQEVESRLGRCVPPLQYVFHDPPLRVEPPASPMDHLPRQPPIAVR